MIMRTNKTLATLIAVTLITILWISSTFANGHWGWQWKGMSDSLTTEQKAEIENMSDEEKKEYMQNLREENGMTTWSGTWEWSKDGENKPENAGTWEGNGEWKSENGQWSENKGNWNSALKAKYKNTYEDKYGSLIAKMDNDKLNAFIDKIDGITEKVNNWDYSDETREKFNAMLNALREIATDNINE